MSTVNINKNTLTGLCESRLKNAIQIRSNVMDRIAEFGVASHWKYKDPKKIKESDTKEYKWMHDLLYLMNQSTNY